MRDNNATYFDMSSLLKLRDLNIRDLAAKNISLQAAEYFKRVSRFIDKSPKLLESLSGIADGTAAGKDSLNRLAELKDLLAGIGCHKYDADIAVSYTVIKTGGRATSGSELFSGFNTLYQRIEYAQVNATPGSAIERSAKLTLSELLSKTDEEETVRKLRILAVDDVSILLRMLSKVLGEQYEVFTLNSGSQVEEFLMHTTPELFLLDIAMPDMDGYDLIPIIRRFEEHKDTPIMFITGNATQEHLKRAVALGVCDFVSKPIEPNALLEKIEKRIVKKKLF